MSVSVCTRVYSDEIHAKCDGPECSNASSMKCSRCGVTRYCSKECQLKDWNRDVNPHKEACKIITRVESSTNASATTASSSALIPVKSTAVLSRIQRWDKMLDIGEKLYGEGYYAHAMQVFRKCVAEFSDIDNANNLGRTFMVIGNTHRAQGEYAKSLAFQQKALSITLKTVGPDHINVGAIYGNMATVYVEQGDHEKALDFHEKCLRIKLDALGPDHPHVGSTYINMGTACENQGDYAQAIIYFEMGLRIKMATGGPNYFEVGATYVNMGNAYQCQGDYNKALYYHEKAREITEHNFGPDHVNVGAAYGNMAISHEEQGNHAKALDFHKECLRIKLQTYGPAHPEVGLTYNNLGNFYRKRVEDHIKSKQFYESAYDIYLHAFGENHPKTKRAYEKLDLPVDIESDASSALVESCPSPKPFDIVD